MLVGFAIWICERNLKCNKTITDSAALRFHRLALTRTRGRAQHQHASEERATHLERARADATPRQDLTSNHLKPPGAVTCRPVETKVAKKAKWVDQRAEIAFVKASRPITIVASITDRSITSEAFSRRDENWERRREERAPRRRTWRRARASHSGRSIACTARVARGACSNLLHRSPANSEAAGDA